jgi:hypothetical protein
MGAWDSAMSLSGYRSLPRSLGVFMKQGVVLTMDPVLKRKLPEKLLERRSC